MPPADDARHRRPRPPIVIDSAGGRHPFLRGMITHDLVKRGMDFEHAYQVASAVRDEAARAHEVTTAQLREMILAQLEKRFGGHVPEPLRRPWQPVHELRVIYEGEQQPFSRGVLARSIHAAGVDLDRAYRLVTDLEANLHQERVAVLSSAELARRVDELLERREGASASRRYRTIRRIRRLPRPVIVYIGGASGTGKSSLALELAPLLRIYRVTATDTIRQVMRMVFTPNILPVIHRSTFELGTEDGGEPPADEQQRRRRLLAAYDEQATRVGVGVRAVVERAIAENMSMIVEGVHLRPGIVPFPDLDGAAYQVAIVLGTLDREAHRARLLRRGPGGERRAERYLAAFEEIRTLNDYLLELAEAHDVAMLDTGAETETAADALRLVTAVIQRRVPALAERDWIASRAGAPTLLLIVDGLADRPVRALGGRTPLQAAATPVLDRLAREGQCGLADAVAPGVVADTAAGTLALFGQSPQALHRGPVEALGTGVLLEPGDVALRGNLATVDERGNIVDRRAGRVREEAEQLAADLDRMQLPADLAGLVRVRVRAATEHRLAIVLHGEGLSPAIQGSDPGDGAGVVPPLTPRPLDPLDERAVFTARVLAVFEECARRCLGEHPVNADRERRGLPPANAVLTRGAGRIHRLVSLEEAGLPLRICCVGGDRTVLGVARWLGARLVSDPTMTANLDTDLARKFTAAADALREHDLVVVHVKGADIAAHDRRPDLKVAFLERLDAELGRLLEGLGPQPLRVAVASDHATLSESGQHGADPLPVLIWGAGIEADEVERFDEQSAAAGKLRRFPLQMLLGRLFELS